jgi:hypothetical protein
MHLRELLAFAKRNKAEVEGFGLIRASLKPGEARLVLMATTASAK